MRISVNFTLEELSRSNLAIKRGIDNNPPPEIIENLQLLTHNVLQKIRDKVGPIRITSGYRSPALSRALGGRTNSKSQHLKGQAADIIIVRDGKIENKIIFDAVIELNLDFDQMIWEFGGRWIHISYVHNKGGAGVYRKKNRKQILEAYKDDNNKTKYREYPTNYKVL